MTKQLPAPRHGQILVPTLNGNGGAFLTVDCVQRTDESPQRWTATGLGIDPAALEAVLTESRDTETGAAALTKVRIAVHPREPIGNSHGLAIALADKMARFPPDEAPKPIFATGVVLRDGRGRLGPVDGFADKARMVAEAAPDGAIFAYCKANEAEAHDVMDAMRHSGRVILRPATTMAELADLWAQPASAVRAGPIRKTPSLSRRHLGWAGAAVGLVMAAAIAMIVLSPLVFPDPQLRRDAAWESIVKARLQAGDYFPRAMSELDAVFSTLRPDDMTQLRQRDPTLSALADIARRHANVGQEDIDASDARIAAYAEAARRASSPASVQEQADRRQHMSEERRRLTTLDRDRRHPELLEAERIHARLAGEAAMAEIRIARAARARRLQGALQDMRPELAEQLAKLAQSAADDVTALDRALSGELDEGTAGGFVPQGWHFPPRND